MLGPAFAFKCLMSPLVKLHLFRTFTCPIIRSGLSSFALRSQQISPLSLFHRKTLKAFLHLSQSAPTPAIHFLLGEMPIEGKIHCDMFSLFYSVWSNPDTKIYQIVKYLLKTSPENSRTWVINLRHISKMYSLEDPLSCLQSDPPSKSNYKERVLTKVLAFHEDELKTTVRQKQEKDDSYMKYFNVNLFGLRGRHHPSLSNIITSEEVRKLRPHIKFLSGDYLTYQKKYNQSQQGSPLCRTCRLENESICHIIAICPSYESMRTRIFKEIAQISLLSRNKVDFETMLAEPETISQYVLDPTSFNLNSRVHMSDPVVESLYRLSRDLCYTIHTRRMKILGELSKT